MKDELAHKAGYATLVEERWQCYWDTLIEAHMNNLRYGNGTVPAPPRDGCQAASGVGGFPPPNLPASNFLGYDEGVS